MDCAVLRMTVVSRGYVDKGFRFVVSFLCDTFRKTGSYQNWFPDRFENNVSECLLILPLRVL